MTRFKKNRPDVAVVTGFGDTPYIDELGRALKEKIDFRSLELIMNVPLLEAHKHPEVFILRLCEMLSNADQKVLIGHSYGALLALIAACRLEFRNVSDLFLIDGPLRSDVEVPSVKAFAEFTPHYEYRKTAARECETVLASIDHPRIIAMGSRVDRIVPCGAKFLKGDQFGWIEVSDDSTTIPFEPLRSYNILYPPSYSGHQLSRERVDMVTNIMSWALAPNTSASTPPRE